MDVVLEPPAVSVRTEKLECFSLAHPRPKPIGECDYREILRRYPRVCAHLVCDSLGYYSPDSAAYALRDIALGRPAYSEWFMHMASVQLKNEGAAAPRDADGYVDEAYYQKTMIGIGRHILERAVKSRSHHHGMMADYGQARAVIAHKLTPRGEKDFNIALSSWQ